MRHSILVLGLLLTVHFSQAQVTGAAAIVALEEVDAKVREHLQSVDNLFNNAIGDAGNAMLAASARLSEDINNTIGHTNNVLNAQQLGMFNLIQSQLATLNEYAEKHIGDIQHISNTLSSSADDFLWKDKEPRIMRYSTPPFIREYTETYRLSAQGKNFDRSKLIVLEVGGQRFEPVQKTANLIAFDIPKAVLASDSSAYSKNGVVTFEWRSGFRSRLRELPVLIPVLPKMIGEVVVYYNQPYVAREYNPQEYRERCDCTTGQPGYTGGRRRSTSNFNVVASNGQMIDTESVRVLHWDQRYGGGHHITRRNEHTIQGHITCHSDSRPRGGRGSSTLILGYKQYKNVTKTKRVHTEMAGLTSYSPLIMNIPTIDSSKPPTVSEIIITTFDNKEITLSPLSNHPLFKVQMIPGTGVEVSWKGN